MSSRVKVIAITFVILLASADAGARSAGVSHKPILKPGQEARYSLSGSVDTQITPAGANGIGGAEHRELSATLLLRAGVAVPPVASQQAAPKVGTTVFGTGLPYSSETVGAGADVPSKDLIYYEAI